MIKVHMWRGSTWSIELAAVCYIQVSGSPAPVSRSDADFRDEGLLGGAVKNWM